MENSDAYEEMRIALEKELSGLSNNNKSCQTICYIYDELNKDLLKEFSEGSKALEDLLNYCYDNHIETRACCVGHKERGPISTPYIMFIIDKEQYSLMESVINNMLNESGMEEDIQIEMQKEKEKTGVTFRYNKIEENLREEFFNCINKSISTSLDKGIYNGLFNSFNNLNKSGEFEFNIGKDGIKVSEIKNVIRKMVNGEFVKTGEDEQGIDVSLYEATNEDFIKTDDIKDYISMNKGKTL